MGYTHYFYRKELTHDDETWDLFIKDVKEIARRFNLITSNSQHFITDMKVTRELDIAIGDGVDQGGSPIFNNKEVWFNGVGDNSHETMAIYKDMSHILTNTDDYRAYQRDNWEKNGEVFSCVKTQHKPYDVLVTAVLVLYKYHFKDKVSIASDGGPEGLEEGLALVEQFTDVTIPIHEIYAYDDEDEI